MPKVTGKNLSTEAATSGVSEATIEEYEAAAFDVAHQAFANSSMRDALVGCTPQSNAGDACVASTLTRVGRLAFRRDLTADELTQYTGYALQGAQTLSGPWEGLEMAVAALFQSPHFLYRAELGAPVANDPQQLLYTPEEMASRLSFFFWNTGPDAALLNAAKQGELQTAQSVRTTATAMLKDPRATKGLRRFFADWLKLDGLQQPLDKDLNVFPLTTATLGAAMLEELNLKLTDMALSDTADFNQIVDSDVTYVNAELAKLYQLPAVSGSGFSRVQLPADGPRVGLMGSGGILALIAKPTKTFPTERGLFVLEQLLCEVVAPPPPGVNTNLMIDPNAPPMTRRQQLSGHLQGKCAECHARMDPIGLALEEFDGIGAFRTTEYGLDIDPSGTLGGVAFKDARELSTVIRSNPKLPHCTVRQLYKFATGHANTPGERLPLKGVTDAYVASNRQFKTLLTEIVVSDGFRLASPPAP